MPVPAPPSASVCNAGAGIGPVCSFSSAWGPIVVGCHSAKRRRRAYGAGLCQLTVRTLIGACICCPPLQTQVLREGLILVSLYSRCYPPFRSWTVCQLRTRAANRLSKPTRLPQSKSPTFQDGATTSVSPPSTHRLLCAKNSLCFYSRLTSICC